MIELLKEKCQSNNLNYLDNDTHGNQIDCMINGYNIQCKSSSLKICNQYRFGLNKDVSQIATPYSDKDNIHFFIFHITDSNYFYVIPISKLIEYGYISTVNQTGKIDICLSIKGSKVTDVTPWNFEFLDRFDLLQHRKTKLKLMYQVGLDEKLILNNLYYTVKDNKTGCVIDSINGKKIKYCTSSYSRTKNSLYSFTIVTFINNIITSFVDIDYEFLICEIINNHNLFYIIPGDTLIQGNYITSSTIRIASPNYQFLHWSTQYLNRFDLLR